MKIPVKLKEMIVEVHQQQDHFRNVQAEAIKAQNAVALEKGKTIELNRRLLDYAFTAFGPEKRNRLIEFDSRHYLILLAGNPTQDEIVQQLPVETVEGTKK